MTKQQLHLFRGLLLCLIPLISVSTVLRTLLLFRHYDHAYGGYYPSAGLLDDVTYLFLFLGVLLTVAFGIFTRKKISFDLERDSLAEIFPASFSALMLMALGIVTLISSVTGNVSLSVRLLSIFLLIFSAVGCVYFIFCALGGGKDGVRALTLLSAVLALVATVIYVYFDSSVLLGSSSKLLVQIALILLFFFLLTECRFYIDRATPVLHLVTAILSVLFATVSSIPNLIYVAIRHQSILASPITDFLMLALSLFAAVRLCRVALKAFPRIDTIVDVEPVSDVLVDDGIPDDEPVVPEDEATDADAKNEEQE
ncbi:MAG: hypothetical protein IJW71_04135 [Clostridia bacterium]|nr:hypothetical protein [Clostridia bacterium]